MITSIKVCTVILTGFLCAFTTINLSATNINTNPTVDLFENIHVGTDKIEFVEDATYFTINKAALKQIHQQKLETMTLQIPFGATKKLEVNLTKASFLANDFKVILQGRDSHNTLSYSPSLYYRGAIAGVKDALVTINFFKEEVTGVLSLYGENYNIGRFQNGDSNTFVLYKERGLNASNPFSCAAEDPESITISRNSNAQGRSTNSVGVYVECDYHLFKSHGSNAQKTTDFATGLFNVVTAIYANDDIDVQLSELKIWTVADPYPTNSAKQARDAFGASLNGKFNGDVAHLLSNYTVNGTVPNGGSANIDALCDKEKAVGYTNITTSYKNYPTYSWTAYAVTHEIGHNLGSPHTHSCLWPTGPIDNCWCPEGDCDQGAEPASTGGSVMSYCHLNPQWTNDCDLSSSNPGINLAGGFGALPVALIKDRLANASCLGSNGGGGVTYSFQANANAQKATCNQQNGSVELTVSFGQTPYTYQWSNGATTKNISNLTEGDYSVTITDASGKATTAKATVEGTAPIVIDAGADKIIGCADPIVTLDASNSVGGFSNQYLWTKLDGRLTGNVRQATLPVSEAGTYILTIKNIDTKCEAKDTVMVWEDFSTPNIALTGEMITCENELTTINVISNQTIASYEWTGPNTFSSNEISPIVAVSGVYKVVVTGLNGCTAEEIIEITGSNKAPALTAQGGMISCQNATTQLVANAGANDVSFKWTGPNGYNSITQNPVVSQAGTYTVKITATNGCTAQKTVEVIGNTELPSVTAFGGVISCQNTTTQLVANAGANDVSFEWTGPNGYNSSAQNPVVNQVGIYTVKITAPNGCTAQKTVEVIGNTELPSVTAFGGLITCANSTTQLTATTSVADATYAWVGPNNFQSTQQNPTVNEEGVYTVTISTPNGCATTTDAMVTKQLTEPVVRAKGGTINCVNREIIFQVNTDETNLNYSWTGPNGFISTEKTPTTMTAGIYQLTAGTDGGCSTTLDVLIEEDLVKPQVVIKGENITCSLPTATLKGLSNDKIDSYTWEGVNGVISEEKEITVNEGGLYQLIAIGTNGCSTTETIRVEENNELPTFEVKGNELTCANPTTQLSVVYDNTNLAFEWTGPNNFTSNEATPTVDVEGTYTLVVSNENGCTSTASLNINKVEESTIEIAGTNFLSCEEDTITIDATNSILTPNAIAEWTTTDGNIVSMINDLEILVDAAGTYVLTIRDAKTECVTFQAVTIENTPSIAAKIENQNVLTCEQTSLMLSANGGTYSSTTVFKWATEEGSIISDVAQREIRVDAPGFYTLFVTDTVTGCTDATFTSVGRLAPVHAELATPMTLNCMRSIVTISGATSTVSAAAKIEWTRNGEIIENSNALFLNTNVEGTYSMTITDTLSGCTSMEEVEVLESKAPELSIAKVEQDVCGKSEGSIALNVAAVGDYQIQWNTGEEGAMIENLEAGTYSVTLTDEIGCQVVMNQKIESTFPVSLGNVNIRPITCNAAQNGAIDLKLKGGNLPYETQWSNGTTDLYTNQLGEGTHTLEVIDAKGCVSTFDFEMKEPTAVEAQVEITGNDVNIEVTGGTPDYEFNWNTGLTEASAENLMAGKYKVEIADANGCTTIKNFEIDQVTSLQEVKGEMEVIAYPNPTTDYFKVAKKLKQNGPIQLAVFSLDGKKMMSKTVTGQYLNERVEVASWEAGVYFLQVQTEKGISTQKIEVIRL